MNILYINHYAGSPYHGMEYRPYYLSREWVRAGHSVRILAGAFSHVRIKQPTADGQVVVSRANEDIDGIEYVWYPTPIYKGNGLGRVRNIWAFLRQVWIDSTQIVTEFNPDVVIASSTYPLDIWCARRIARQAKAKLLYEVHDLWPLSLIELGGMSPHHLFVRLCQLAENAAYRDADFVISLLPNVHEHMAKHGLDLSKLHIIPNGISMIDWQGEQSPIDGDVHHCISAIQSRGDFIVGYAGFHGVQNALDPLLTAAALMKNQNVSFILVGDGHEKKRLQERVEQEQLENVKMFSPISKSQIPKLLECFDCAYLGAPKLPIYRFGVSPNKLLDYMMAGVPVLYAIEAGNDLVSEADGGISISADNPNEIARAVEKFIQIGSTKRKEMGAHGQQYVIENLTYNVLADKFIDAIS